MILVGLAFLGFGLHMAIGDFLAPRLIVEGRIDRMSRSEIGRDKLSIVIDGIRYDTLRDVFLAATAGDRVRAEIGAGSKTILRMEPLRSALQ